ncbi:hypothetical protein GCM10010842_03880 [Deinococcus daejeonensis]|uniref:Uncharacterized protein n=1 Tax=Deinococcus daejeonensis TaxID=1007098 RepID=A0ABQ2ISY5_9DEIO|nr:hypothetical protein GCM10010842_03880 [Deinococcus daejeonensis]
MPARTIQKQHNDVSPGGVHGAVELLQCHLHGLDTDRGQDQKIALPGGGLYEHVDVDPLKSSMLHRDRSLTFRRPHSHQDRFEPNPALILDEQAYPLMRVRCLGDPQRPAYFF